MIMMASKRRSNSKVKTPRHLPPACSIRRFWLVILTVFVVGLAGIELPLGGVAIFAFAQEWDSSIVVASTDGNLPESEVAKFIDAPETTIQECPNTQALEAELSRSTTRIEQLMAELETAKLQLELAASKHGEEVHGYQARLSEVKSELAAAISERNESFQNSKSLEEKMGWMEQEHLKILNETNNELDALYEDIERKKKIIQSTEDRHRETRKRLSELDSEVRKMHQRAVSQYVNFTLMQEDAWSVVADTVSKTSRRVERRWERVFFHYRPRYQRAKDRVRRECRKLRSYLVPKFLSMKRKTFAQWNRSEYIRPILESSWQVATKFGAKFYSHFEPTINEATEACRLSAISAIEEVSKTILNYLEASAKKDKERMTRIREKERKKDPVHRQREMMRHHRHDFGRGRMDDFEGHVEPSAFHLKIREFFMYTLNNSKDLVKRGTSMLPTFIMLVMTRRLVIGCLLLYFGFPAVGFWMTAIIKLLLNSRKARPTQRKSIGDANHPISAKRPAPQCTSSKFS